MPESPVKSLFSFENDVLRQVLREERKRLGLNQTEVAKPCGWEQSVIAKIEQGERRIDVVEFVRLAEAMGQKPEKLFATFLRALRSAGR
ncbi:DNA-binding protein [Opitutaceae bacterium TAV5]|nr:DNA-binding protein [Opitutaceae bacterium TAV5]